MSALEPMVVMIGDVAIEHGERGRDLDAENPEACLCGLYDDYLWCPGEGIAGLLIERDDDGFINVSRPAT